VDFGLKFSDFNNDGWSLKVVHVISGGVKFKLLLKEKCESLSFLIKIEKLLINLINKFFNFNLAVNRKVGTLSIINLEIKEINLDVLKFLFKVFDLICSLGNIIWNRAVSHLFFNSKYSFITLICIL